MNRKRTINSFFAGIGGFDLGFQQAGVTPVFHCEINKFCNDILRKHWPLAISHNDIGSIDSSNLPHADIWCGGFPCQDVSVARGWLGRDGLKGKNTGLFFPFVNLIKTKLPRVVLMENVSGLLSSHDGKDFLTILRKLDELGYSVAWRTFNTRYFGAPQSRPRVYICAWRDGGLSSFTSLYEPGETHIPESPRLGFLREDKCPKTKACVPEVAFCLAATSGRHTGTDWSRTYISYSNKVRRLTPSECEKLQGFPVDWTVPSDSFHLSEARVDSQRYHAIGNAVSVPVVKWIANRICSELDLEETCSTRKHVSVEKIKDLVSDFSSSKAMIVNINDLKKIKWQAGGFMHKSTCVTAPTSPAPTKPIKSRLVDILDETKPNYQYFLSSNAATGILRRVESQNRELFRPLHAALLKLSTSK